MDISKYVLDKAKAAHDASKRLYSLSTEKKNQLLLSMADALESGAEFIKKENEKDISTAVNSGLSSAMLDRLLLSDSRIAGMVQSLRDVASLPDPTGDITGLKMMKSGIRVGQVRVPIGVIGMIYESRPNVTADAAGLCIKSGNAVFLRGGSEAINSNLAIVKLMTGACDQLGFPDIITFLDVTDRAAVQYMITADEYIDLIIPRGGEGLIRAVVASATIPVIMHYKGVCHAYVDRYASLDMAWNIVYNSKVQRPGVCNALETLLVHQDIAGSFLPEMKKRFDDAGLEIRGCDRTTAILPGVKKAVAEDWDAEYLDLILAIRVVDSMQEAIDHISMHGSGHTETIITDNHSRGMKFLMEVDSSAVMLNASTRFNDGGEFGLGAEIGISTSKLHVRGPMGLNDLVCSKYIVLGDGQVRS